MGAQDELERQRKKDEQEHKKAEKDIERMIKKDEAEHQKVLKELDAKEKKDRITREERDGLMKEFDIELARYKEVFGLAQEAMRDSLAKRRTCKICHEAPKIDWASSPPRVVPGTVQWNAGGY